MSDSKYVSEAPNNFRTQLGYDIFKGKYALAPEETWLQRAQTIVDHIAGTAGGTQAPLMSKTDLKDLVHFIHTFKLLPGGRTIYYAGRGTRHYSNCHIFLGEEDTREEWGRLIHASSDALMSGGGIGIDYSIFRPRGALLARTGGVSSGPVVLAEAVNEYGRRVKQGGGRRCLPGSTLVTRPNGERTRIDKIEVGMEVQTRFGPRKVTAVFDQGVQDTVEITTTHGRVISTTNHRWLGAQSSRSKGFFAVSQLKPGHKLYYHGFKELANPNVADNLHPKEAYTRGFFMGNGCAYSSNRTHEVTFQFGNAHITPAQLATVSEYMTTLGTNPIMRPGHGDCTELRCRSKPLVTKFQEWKAPHQPPIIPDEIFGWSTTNRAKFLAGWFDADGYLSEDKWCISNKHETTCEELRRLFESLGFLTTISVGGGGYEVRVSSYQRAMFLDLIAPYMFKEVGEAYHDTSEVPAKIISIKDNGRLHTWDIEVEDVHEFIADNFVSHNSAIYGSLNWQHGDADEWMYAKDWENLFILGTDVTYAEAKMNNFDAQAPLDMTNISFNYDNAFLRAIANGVGIDMDDDELEELVHSDSWFPIVDNAELPETFVKNVEMAMRNGEPGFSFNFFSQEKEVGRNACVTADTRVLTRNGHVPIGGLIDQDVDIWNGEDWSTVKPFSTGRKSIYEVVLSDGRVLECSGNHEFVMKDGETRVEAQDLIGGEALIAWEAPVIPNLDAEDQRSAQRFVRVTSVTPTGREEETFCLTEDKRHMAVFNGVLTGQCTEVTSADDSDMCNLASVNMAACQSKAEFERAVELGTKFLVCVTIRGELPTAKSYIVREKNRRLGLGLMGMHEWLIQHNSRYEVTPELHEWLAIYRDGSRQAANEHADRFFLSRPVATTAIAPTGCQHPDTMVVTDKGILPIGSLVNEMGDTWQEHELVVATDRTPQVSTRGFVNGLSDTLRVETSSGGWLEATPNHQYRALRKGQYEWVRVDNLVEGDLLVIRLGGYTNEKNVDLVQIPNWHHNQRDMRQPSKLTPDVAKWLGMYYSNGSTHAKGIRIHHNSLQNEWEEAYNLTGDIFDIYPEYSDNGDGHCATLSINSTNLLAWLAANRLTKPKASKMRFPEAVLRSSRASIQAFLEGYFWGDGSTTKNGVRQITSRSNRFIQELQAVSRALGGDVSINTQTSGMGSPMYRATFVKTKRRDETREITEQLKALGLENCTVDRVTSITNSQCMTLDLEVPETTTYLANGVVSHNTIGTMAGTTTGLEPIYAVAMKRRYLEPDRTTGLEIRKYQYIIDTAARTVIEKTGVDPDSIDTAAALALDPERRIKFQADVQAYTAMSISSTLNLPAWGSDANNHDMVEHFARTLAKYTPRLRGMTMYPDGSRGGQPLVPVPYAEASGNEGVAYEETTDMTCKSGVCGI